jgi:hypothetical protein
MVQKGSRVVAIYDVHGNLPALEAVLADLESINPDLIVVGGDVVAGPMPAEVLDRLAALSLRASAFFEVTSIGRSSQPTTTDATPTPLSRQILRSALLCSPPPRSTALTGIYWPPSPSV